MTATKHPAPFNIIRQRGTPDRGQLPDGRPVYALKKIWFDQVGRFVPVAPYSDHFIYEVPADVKGPRWRCSCGSMAVASGFSSYESMASAQGLLFVCHHHSTFGVHLGGSKWV
jgi:hypothetical protein